jgi:hypothetical protein
MPVAGSIQRKGKTAPHQAPDGRPVGAFSMLTETQAPSWASREELASFDWGGAGAQGVNRLPPMLLRVMSSTVSGFSTVAAGLAAVEVRRTKRR